MPSPRIRNLAAVAALSAVLAAPPPVFAQVPAPAAVRDASFRLPGGERVLELSVDLPAPVATVWQALTTAEGFMRWAVPVARVDLRVGGEYETSYDPKVPLGSPATIRNRIEALVPHRLLVIRNVQAPPGAPFDVAAFQRLQTVMQVQPLDESRTRLTLQSGPFGSGPEADSVWRHFHAGNTWTLGRLHEHLAAPAAPR